MNSIAYMKHYKKLFFVLVILTLATSCIPPRCHIQKCAIVMDHLHGRHNKQGLSVKNKRNELVLYRGLPWYRYLFRKRHKPRKDIQPVRIKGRYRNIDTREAFDKK